MNDMNLTNDASLRNAASTDRPVGFWPLIPAAALLLQLLLNVFNHGINSVFEFVANFVLGMNLEYPWYVSYSMGRLLACVYVISAVLVFAKMSKGGNVLGKICLYAWAALRLLRILLDMGFLVSYQFIGNVDVASLFGSMARVLVLPIMILFILFLLLELFRTSTYKAPLIVALASAGVDVFFRLISALFSVFRGGGFFGAGITIGTGVAHNLSSILMIVAFVMLFLASRKLKQKAGA